jgi:hypothetical protein
VGREPGSGPAQLTCPDTDTAHSDQSVPVLFVLLFLKGRTELHDGRWRITALSAVDNAAGGGQEGRYPRFDVRADGQVIKPEIPGHENDALRPAITYEYQLTQVWVYAKEEPSVRNQSAWWP